MDKESTTDDDPKQVVDERTGELTDEQLEEVIGGMPLGIFSTWRARMVNEGR